MNFTNHYYNDMYELNEGILGDIAKAGLTGVGKLYRTLKPKVKKINNFNDVINPANVVEIPCSLVNSLSMLLGGDVMKWRSISKGKNLIQKFILGGKEVYAKDNWAGVINPDLHDEMQEVFKLTDQWYLVSMDIYILTNGSKISLITLSDPYKGDVGDRQLQPKKVEQFTRKLQNCKGFISVTKKSDEWFLSKFGQRFTAFIASRYKPNEKQWKQDMENVEKSYEGETDATPTKETDVLPANDKDKKSIMALPDGTKIKYEHKFLIDRAKYDRLGFSADPKNNLKLRLKSEIKTVKPFKTNKIDGKKYTFTNGGEATLFRDIEKDKHYVVSDDLGQDVLVTNKIVKGK